VWLQRPDIPVLIRLRQEDGESEASQDYIVSSRPVWGFTAKLSLKKPESIREDFFH
jgi:hypothetical protein